MSSNKQIINNNMLPFKYDTQNGGVKHKTPGVLSKKEIHVTGCAGGLHIISELFDDNLVDKSLYIEPRGGFARDLLFPGGLSTAAAALGLFAASELSQDILGKGKNKKSKNGRKKY